MNDVTTETSTASTENCNNLEVANTHHQNKTTTAKELMNFNGGVGVDCEHAISINVTGGDLKNGQDSQSASSENINGIVVLSPPELPSTQNNEQKPKPKRRSRLSLNSDVKGKNSKFKEEEGQATLKSFFETMSPQPGDNKTVLINSQENADIKLAEKSHEAVNLKDNKPESKNHTNYEASRTNTKKEKKKSADYHHPPRKNRGKKENKHKSSPRTLDKEKQPLESNSTEDKVTKDTEQLQGNIRNHDDKAKDSTDTKKVRFSEEIQEYSPEQVWRKSLPGEVTNEGVSRLENEIGPKPNKNQTKNADLKLAEGDSASCEANSDSELKNMIKNVFTFMMDSRHKSIGQNSPGKELENEEELPEVRKAGRKKMAVRKEVFKVWANAKGAKKRKIEDIETGLVIEHKLKKRAKRMKKMLTQNYKNLTSTYSDDDADSSRSEIKTKKRKITQIMTSDSDSDAADCNKVVEVKETKEITKKVNKQKIKEKLKRFSEDTKKPSEKIEVKDKKTKHKADLKMPEKSSKEIQARDTKSEHKLDSKVREKLETRDKKENHRLNSEAPGKILQEVEDKNKKIKHKPGSKNTAKISKEVKEQTLKRDSKTTEKIEIDETKSQKEKDEPDLEYSEKSSKKVNTKNKKRKHKPNSKIAEKASEEVQATNEQEEYKIDSKTTVKTSEATDNKEKRKRETEDRKVSLQKDKKSLITDQTDHDDTAVDDKMFFKHKKPKLLLTSESSSSSSECNVTSETKSITNSNRISLQQTDLSSFFAILNKNTKTEADNQVKSKLEINQNLSKSNWKNGETIKGKRKSKSKLTLKSNNHVVSSDDFSNSFVEVEADKKGEIIIELTETTFQEDDEEGKSSAASLLKKLEVLTPRSAKQWRMRLKINLSDVDDETIDRLVQPHTYIKSTDSMDDSKKLQKTKTKLVVDSESELDSDDESLASKQICSKNVVLSEKIKPVKLAPLFIKNNPKSKSANVDEAILEARRKFLHSSMPESLKKTFEQQQSLNEIEFEIFPLISHITVQPTEEQLKTTSINFWNLPATDLKFTTSTPYSAKTSLNLGSITTLTAASNTSIQLQPRHKLTNLKTHLKQIKDDNPTYPVYKAFRFLHQKNSRRWNDEPKTKPLEEEPQIKSKKSKRGRPKKNKKIHDEIVETVEVAEQPQLLVDVSKHEIWTDKYRPCTSDEIFGNHASVSQFKKWLETWLDFSEEINVQRSRRRRVDSGSSSDFETTDGDCREGLRLPGNTVILCGPNGSGKTTAVYALCSELGINVLELNASSKRTGKRLLQELQEATQSHQVRKNDSSSFSTFLKKDESSLQSTDSQSSTSTKKMCLLFIEDVDIVFEQDENFITALNQLLTTSKRPLVLTTTDKNCLHLKKFLAQYPIMSFSPLSTRILGTWLQVLCLVEGLQVDRQALVELLEHNRGDVRRTLLQLQFWVQSGGQAKLAGGDSASQLSVGYGQAQMSKSTGEEFLCNDDSCNLVWFNEDAESEVGDKNTTHSNCLESFKYFKNYNQMFISLPLDLGDIWWNLSNWLCIGSPLRQVKNEVLYVQNLPGNDQENATQNLPCTDINKTESKHLLNILNIFETLAMTDVMHETLNIDCNIGPAHKNKDARLKNSLELKESMQQSCYASRDLTYDLSHTALNGYVRLYNGDKNDCVNSDACSIYDEKLCKQQNKCEEALLGAVPLFCRLDRGSVSLDYMSTLRTMARSEDVRASNNNKRRNRFYNYLRGVGVGYNDGIFQTACRVFHPEN